MATEKMSVNRFQGKFAVLDLGHNVFMHAFNKDLERFGCLSVETVHFQDTAAKAFLAGIQLDTENRGVEIFGALIAHLPCHDNPLLNRMGLIFDIIIGIADHAASLARASARRMPIC